MIGKCHLPHCADNPVTLTLGIPAQVQNTPTVSLKARIPQVNNLVLQLQNKSFLLTEILKCFPTEWTLFWSSCQAPLQFCFQKSFNYDTKMKWRNLMKNWLSSEIGLSPSLCCQMLFSLLVVSEQIIAKSFLQIR